jgi:glycine/D-amino acid oxidase-like deaminating enzyme
MRDTNANVVICGAGIAGVAAAYYLSKLGVEGILLVDQGNPLSLTSDKSTEAYRNWWPGPDNAMIELMNRSIDLIEGFADESNISFESARISLRNRRRGTNFGAKTDRRTSGISRRWPHAPAPRFVG